MSDLHAIAVVRRLLLELGCVLAPYETHPHLGRLALWIAQPRPDLNGQTPLKTLGHDGGEARVRQCLARVLAGREASSGMQ